MARQVALLRGINLGSNRRVSMGDLRKVLEDLGYEDVRTHLQSGNVVLSSQVSGARLERALERQLVKGLGIEVEVLVPSRKQLADVVARDPLGKVAKDPSRCLVSSLRSKPPAKVVRELEATDLTPERLVVAGRELYAWQPGAEGAARDRTTPWQRASPSTWPPRSSRPVSTRSCARRPTTARSS